MAQTEVDLYRPVRAEDFPDGTVIDGRPAAAILHPAFRRRILPSGRARMPDERTDASGEWVYAGGGTSLFDRADVFRGRRWHSFELPSGTVVPESLAVRFTHYSRDLGANHYQIESRAERMRADAYRGALDNLARNAVVRAVELSRRGARQEARRP